MSATLTMESKPVIFGFAVRDPQEALASRCQPHFIAKQPTAATEPPMSLPPLVARKPILPTAAAVPRQQPTSLTTAQLPSSPLVSAAPASPLGWDGLLQISRMSGVTGVLGCQPPVEDEPAHSTKIEVCCMAHTNSNVRRLMKSVIRGLKACQEPEKSKEGMGGTYFFTNENGRKVAIMKPCDEEPLAPNNPKGYVGRALGEPGWKPTVRVGEAAMREVAAYLLDHDGWAKVPTSVLVRARHPIFCYNNRMSSVRQSSWDLAALGNSTVPALTDAAASPPSNQLPMKLGSLQEFVSHMCDTSEMGPSKFSARDVHRIAILDIRLFNTDRHAGNMLVRERKNHGSCANLVKAPMMGVCDSPYELIPIDHGFCLPETLEACYFEWQHWPQAMLPFTDEELQYISSLDIEADKELIRKELPSLRPECLRVMEVSTTLLQLAAEAGLTLYEIASVMTRPFEGGDEEPSQLELTVAAALSEAVQEPDADCVCDDTIEEAVSEGDDSESEEYDGDDDAFGVQFEGTDAMAAARGGMGNQLIKQASSGGEAMLFDLDEDTRTPHHTSRSPGGISLGSSLDSSADDFSFGLSSSVMGSSSMAPDSSTAGSGRSKDVQKQQAGLDLGRVRSRTQQVALPQLATSVHVTDGGFLWRRMKRESGRPASATKHSRKRTPVGGSRVLAAKKGAGICSPQAYPPPVVAFAPDSLNGLFCDIDEQQWARFMQVYKDRVEDALVAGIWKQSLGKDASVAQSCPRF